jgi:hypothetical protein
MHHQTTKLIGKHLERNVRVLMEVLPRFRVVCTLFIGRVLVWMTGFVDTLFTQYSGIAHLNTLQFSVTHALRFSVFASRILATGL